MLKEINPEYSLEGLKQKLQNFGNLMRTANSLEKTLMWGKMESRRRGQQRIKWLDGITNAMGKNGQTSGKGEGLGSLAWCSPWGHEESHMMDD